MVEETKTEVKDVAGEQVSPLEEAKTLLDEMRKEKAEIVAMMKVQANALLSGRSNGGVQVKTPEELDKDKSQKLADEITNAFK